MAIPPLEIPSFEHPAALAGPPIDWPGLARLLVVRPDNLGDVLMTGPALAALRAAAPNARIDLLAGPAGATAGPLLPELDGVLVGQVSWQRLEPQPGGGPPDRALVDELRARDYTAAVILTSFSQSPWPAGYVCQLAGIPVRAGLSKEFGGAGLTHWVPAPDDGMHQVDRSLYLLDRLGVAPVPPTLHAAVPATARAAARTVLARQGLSAGDPYAVLLPGASCPSRRYPADRFRAVALDLARSGLPVVVCGSASERELARVVSGQDEPGVVTAAGELDVPGLAAVLAGAAVVVANNSGGAHLADAVGTPVVVLFAGTELVDQYQPRSVPAVVLRVPTGCTPCRQLRCPFELPCLDVPPSEVAAAARQLADRRH
ncbi:MAG TPA: glycosyltransferase family 9 protein [Pseudonocardia sp.]|nr:glycosyltransferase family 9 protein [Pseudonocardia sp.]